MKKLLPILLAVAMVLAMSVSALAATLTINSTDDRDYVGYKLLDLTTSLKADCGCADGDDHTDDCYNYAYTLNDKYDEILKEISGKTEEEDVIDYFANLGEEAMREAADAIYAKIAEAGLAADATDLATGSTLEEGYWMIADVTDLDGEYLANSLVMVDTAGQDSIEITPKTGLPTVEKKVKDINDSEDADITDNDWQDSADHNLNDVIPFKLTATLPANLANYDEYSIIFHDTISAGLTFDATSVKVYAYASKDDAANDENGTDVTANFTTGADCDCNCSFTVSCDDVTAINGITKDSVIVVYYNATLNEGAVIGAAGNPNEVYLEFSNNPYDEGTGKTENDKVIVFTYELIINKVDGEGQPLKGAGFTLSKKNAAGEYEVVGKIEAGEATTFTWSHLDDGDYKLEESEVPAGYNQMDPVEFTISAEHDEESADPQLTKLEGVGTVDLAAGTLTEEIVNRSGSILPETGAKGTALLIGCSVILVMLAAVFMVTRKKMSVYED